MMSHLPVLMLISVAIIPQTAADRSMDIFCYRPPNFGKGTYNSNVANTHLKCYENHL
ncbi:hypothetical protein GCK32_020964 [Trichostrongylus colubriformis]|uniref:Uncharacterized protein n=1 Tax=Trichostrongylus colubriformis TaxID=6319 RepID=A0AAN8EYN1_TRICO